METQDPEFEKLPTKDLFGAYRSILAELRRRGVVRTGNAPTGDFAETLVKVAVNGELAPNSEKSWDVRTASGERLQVKSRLLDDPSKGKQRQLSPIRSWGFDSLVIVLFDSNYGVWRGVKIPSRLVRGTGTQSEWVNGELIIARDSRLDHPEAEELTDLLRRTADTL